ncbi:MAG: DUF447 domain-containing protein [Longimicrobiales bacterium]
MIIESIVTTIDAAGAVNFAPMGVVWGEDEIVLKPYRETTTFRNLVATSQAVVNLTDNVLCFALGAIGRPTFPASPASVVRGVVLDDACSWREIEVSHAETDGPRARFRCAIAHRGERREFLGFNRARNAVLEAAILATRTRFLPIDEILADFERLQVIVDKTAGPREKEAMAILTRHVETQAAARA